MPENSPEQVQDPSPAVAPGAAPPVVPEAAPATSSVMDEESNFPRGLAIRLFIYLVAGHAVAGFLWLLFEAGAK
ncbi:DUF6126 family protein [Streptomyces sp. NPDC006645]|uniref:DUF6126 family protein n=1 Tax=unclassified Streptomyces TaxID=2593676 RepID=UPI0033A2B28B